MREPTQVFQLLETLYHHFDEMANRRKVFKVETVRSWRENRRWSLRTRHCRSKVLNTLLISPTLLQIGDCYVAVTGLPEPRDDHAVIMARFAKDIMEKMKRLCQRLEVVLVSVLIP